MIDATRSGRRRSARTVISVLFLAAPSADNGYGETDLVCHLGGRNRCADGRGGNDIVAAGVANIG
jgi:hypothetical protein